MRCLILDLATLTVVRFSSRIAAAERYRARRHRGTGLIHWSFALRTR
jgi:hypothetical protein